MTEIDLRPGLVDRVLLAVSLAAVAVVLLARMLETGAGSLRLALYVAALAVDVFCAARILKTAVVARGDELVVTNPWRTHRLARSELAGFHVGPRLPGGTKRAWADLKQGGRIRLVAVDHRAGVEAMEHELAALDAWRAGSTRVRR